MCHYSEEAVSIVPLCCVGLLTTPVSSDCVGLLTTPMSSDSPKTCGLPSVFSLLGVCDGLCDGLYECTVLYFLGLVPGSPLFRIELEIMQDGWVNEYLLQIRINNLKPHKDRNTLFVGIHYVGNI